MASKTCAVCIQHTGLKQGDFSLFWEDAEKDRFALKLDSDWEEAVAYFIANGMTATVKMHLTGL